MTCQLLALCFHGDQQGEVGRLVSLGATRIDIGQGEVSWVTMADPDGHEFCVLTPLWPQIPGRSANHSGERPSHAC